MRDFLFGFIICAIFNFIGMIWLWGIDAFDNPLDDESVGARQQVGGLLGIIVNCVILIVLKD